eukprot:COSAG06_NODE_1294_length_9970_cov_3.420120_11_plen_91_part_00
MCSLVPRIDFGPPLLAARAARRAALAVALPLPPAVALRRRRDPGCRRGALISEPCALVLLSAAARGAPAAGHSQRCPRFAIACAPTASAK